MNFFFGVIDAVAGEPMENGQVGEEQQQEIVANANKIHGRIVRLLDVGDRLRCERVNRRWNEAMWTVGWTDLKRLDRTIVFSGTTREQRKKFTQEHLIALFHRIRGNLIELKLGGFIVHNKINFGICQSLNLLPNIETLDIESFQLRNVVDFLPETLRSLSLLGGHNKTFVIDHDSLVILSANCPHLEAIHLQGQRINETFIKGRASILNYLFDNYTRLKRLSVSKFVIRREEGEPILSLRELRELEELHLGTGIEVEPETFEGLINCCQKLRCLTLSDVSHQVSAEMFRGLARLPLLEELEIFEHPTFTDEVLGEISELGILKKLNVKKCRALSDVSILNLLQNCQQLHTLDVRCCPLITERSLEAVIGEVQRRQRENVGGNNGINWNGDLVAAADENPFLELEKPFD